MYITCSLYHYFLAVGVSLCSNCLMISHGQEVIGMNLILYDLLCSCYCSAQNKLCHRMNREMIMIVLQRILVM